VPTYAIGDVQGCYDELQALLALIEFDQAKDELWFAGDLVNRGPRSLDTLRFVRALGERAITVLGNHDLHLVAAARGYRKPSRRDTLAPILEAPDAVQLIDWVRHLPVMHEARGLVLVHAGLPPPWSVDTARACARELETTLRDDARLEPYLQSMYGDEPSHWSAQLQGQARLRYITNAFTRLRYVDRQGTLDFHEKRPPGEQSATLTPWFQAPGRGTREQRILFGHWATLQLRTPVDPVHRVHPLDHGCVWGGALCALRLQDREMFTVPGWQGLHHA